MGSSWAVVGRKLGGSFRRDLTQQLSELRLIILQSFFKSNLAPSLLSVDLLVLTAMVAGVPVQEINTA